MQRTLFFDGDCGFCRRAAALLARIDRRGRIQLALLQGELSQKLGFEQHAESDGGTMVVFREPDRRVFLRSDALIEIAEALGGGWRALVVLRLVPRRLRDWIYRWIGRNRGRFSRERDSC